MNENVNHPNHYNMQPVETIELVEMLGDTEPFCRSNAIKYIQRAPYKGKTLEDLRKALWYLRRIKGLSKKHFAPENLDVEDAVTCPIIWAICCRDYIRAAGMLGHRIALTPNPPLKHTGGGSGEGGE